MNRMKFIILFILLLSFSLIIRPCYAGISFGYSAQDQPYLNTPGYARGMEAGLRVAISALTSILRRVNFDPDLESNKYKLRSIANYCNETIKYINGYQALIDKSLAKEQKKSLSIKKKLINLLKYVTVNDIVNLETTVYIDTKSISFRLRQGNVVDIYPNTYSGSGNWQLNNIRDKKGNIIEQELLITYYLEKKDANGLYYQSNEQRSIAWDVVKNNGKIVFQKRKIYSKK